MLNKEELKAISEMIYENVSTESRLYGVDGQDIYKKSVNYREKSAIYEKVMSEYLGNEVKVNHNSIFGLLDLE